ncbi:2-amino-4-hydroxy-6-hydroxymethyldihydropteridine diphosphokinase [Aliiglaciecola sp. CAU 1673]|uniref:2-amino-4-hydroxy-6- hydroxymethyldihydropteridine diphosphokinase n=1 Tax=Aliiglaciecola sp. CAU 1673 TaxID=3032595 RepID=UPI0023DA56DE|nr:2-amino-4-hydroxy-6-hydroxymethyldihydropteridine diphosphokinase [Aliiglaciecola sp. CAU 1673]MDF2177806.1 2-amino-4-hydroxy-6-hydroxymethyldihydropteridine diphosphokinase [Aliiglaciecola sp. CAU 1673]
MISCYIGMGANLDDPQKQLQEALRALRRLPDSHLADCSSFYASKPMGPQDQPDYVNAVARLDTRLAPLALLDALQAIEQEQGRVRKSERWGARTLDLDLLLYGDLVVNSERLTLPHYGMREREFVLHPLLEIAPELVLPDGQLLNNLARQCPKNGLMVIRQRSDIWNSLPGSV